jgi:DNA adenine methylase
MAKPFLKWAGGKTQLLEEILSRPPESYSRYIEPMVGGGAVFFSLASRNNPPESVINDLNAELINAYRQIKANPNLVIEELQALAQNSETYYHIRDAERSPEFLTWELHKKAARTIYLNKLGFNGLYRVNSSGFFNVPFGKRSGIDFNSTNILAASEALQSCEIMNVSYVDILQHILPGDWVYLDPPYLPINETSNFTQYTAGGFDITDHRALRQFCDTITERGAKFTLSNAHSNQIIELYSNYNISVVFAKRSINKNGARRGAIPEVIIRNF